MKHPSTKTGEPKKGGETQAAAKPPVPIGRSVHPIIQLQQAIGSRALGAFIQAKLKVSEPGDPFEREADHVAEQIMRMPEPSGHESAVSRDLPPGPILQRKCAECEDEEALQRKPVSESSSNSAPLNDPRNSVLHGSGGPLSASSRAFFEPRFGQDFSHVRIHSGGQAADAARTINARAFTAGSDIVFGAGQYIPESAEGRELIAHELTHTIQQGSPAGGQLQRREMAFNAETLAGILREAMEGLGTDEEAIYAALGGRTQAQIDEITRAYERTGRSLQADLQDELTSGELARLASMAPTASDTNERRAQIVAEQLRNAMEGLGTDETAIYTGLHGHTSDELTAIKAAYLDLTHRALIDDLRDELSGDELNQALGAMGMAPEVYEHNTELGRLSMGNFDFHFNNCNVLVWVWVKYQFTDDITSAESTAFKQRFVNVVHAKWAHSGYSLGGNTNCPCASVPIEIHVEENTGSFYHKLVDVERIRGRESVISDINLGLNTNDPTMAHEFGHVLGLYDEYDGGFFENIMFWHQNRPDDPDAIMNNQYAGQLRPRYFEHYRSTVQATAPRGCDYTVVSPPPGP